MLKKKKKEVYQDNVTIQDVHKLLIRKAFGYTVEETVDEYVEEESGLKLIKRKVTTKHVPPDLSSAKAVLEYLSADIDYSSLTDEELKEERDRLIGLLTNKEVEDGTGEDERSHEV